MASYKTSDIDVVFVALSSGNVRMLGFSEAMLKNFKKTYELFFLNFRAPPWSDNFIDFSLNQSETCPGSGGKSIFYMFTQYFLLFVLKACIRNSGRYVLLLLLMASYVLFHAAEHSSTYLPECAPSKHK